jgi:ATP-binding protein involved in chromosome partitioning
MSYAQLLRSIQTAQLRTDTRNAMPPQVTESDVLGALRPIIDPDFNKSIVELGFIKQLRIDAGKVAFAIELTTPACPVKAEFEKAARERVLALEGVAEVDVTMTANTRGRDFGGGSADVLPGVKNTIAVASGKGGVGKSTTAVNLALALRQSGASVGVMDADVYGPSLPLLTGVSGRPEVRGKQIIPHQAHGMKLMSMGFLINDDSPVIWRGPMVHGLVKQFLTDVDWGELDYLVIDMPPGTGDAALTLTQQAPLAGAVIVTTANELSLIDARKGLKMFQKVEVPVLGILENMSYFSPPDLPDRKYYLFGEGGGKKIAADLDVPFLGEVPIDPRIVEGGDAGTPIVLQAPDADAAQVFRELAGTVARRLAVLADRTPAVADANITWVS